jgi:uncharacterized membrane protein
MNLNLWLSHHREDELDRCYHVGGAYLCARCLGTYPVLFTVFALQLALTSPLHHPWDVPVGTALVVPAALDWAWGRWRPHAFSNAWRSLTGLLLGLGLGRTLYVHAQRPFPPALLAQLGLVAAIALPVVLVAYLRRWGR